MSTTVGTSGSGTRNSEATKIGAVGTELPPFDSK